MAKIIFKKDIEKLEREKGVLAVNDKLTELVNYQ